jgi:hypothetical protein
MPQAPSGYAAAKPTLRRTMGGQLPARSQALARRPAKTGVITDPSSPYAPRLVSVTERVVSPTPADPIPADETAKQTVAKPTALKQAAKPQPVTASQTTR